MAIKMKLLRPAFYILLLSLIICTVNAQDKPGSAFSESEIVLRTSSGGEIFGTLTVPENTKQTHQVSFC